MIRPRILNVFPNPWGIAPNSVTIDEEGRPCGHVPTDPHEDGTSFAWVGVRLDPERTAVLQAVKEGELRSAIQRTVYKFLGISGETVTAAELAKQSPARIPYSHYYRTAISTGELVPADEDTARAAGLAFKKPGERLAELEKAAVEEFDSHHGKGTFAALAKRRASEIAEEKQTPAPASTKER